MVYVLGKKNPHSSADKIGSDNPIMNINIPSPKNDSNCGTQFCDKNILGESVGVAGGINAKPGQIPAV